jgi:hypothetical protein
VPGGEGMGGGNPKWLERYVAGTHSPKTLCGAGGSGWRLHLGGPKGGRGSRAHHGSEAVQHGARVWVTLWRSGALRQQHHHLGDTIGSRLHVRCGHVVTIHVVAYARRQQQHERQKPWPSRRAPPPRGQASHSHSATAATPDASHLRSALVHCPPPGRSRNAKR